MSPTNHLGRYFRSRRLQENLSLGETARRLGYINISKGARRVQQLEEGANYTADLLGRLVRVFEVDPCLVQELRERDHAEYLRGWEQWVDEPVPMRLVIRYMPAVYGELPLPSDVTTPEQAIAYGQGVARTMGLRLCIELSRRVAVYIDETGVANQVEATPESDPRPFMQVGRDRFRLRLEP